MEIGKIPPEILNKIVLNPINHFAVKRNDVFLRPKTGEDCSAVLFGEELCILSADPITGAEQDIGYIAVHINCNDIASSGAEPIGILLTVLLPEGSSEAVLCDIMEGAYEAAKEIGIEILGGHTEVTNAVNKTIVSGAVIGRTDKNHFISTGGAKVGQDVIMTKCAGLEGTVILAKEYETILSKKIDTHLLQKAKSMRGFLSVIKESRIAKNMGATAMHDVTEGGIFGALWEMASASGTGLEVDLHKIPIRQETIEVCEVFDINPYMLISSGAMLIGTDHGSRLVEELKKAGIHSAVVGHATEGNDRVIMNGDERRFLEPPKTDELFRAGKD